MNIKTGRIESYINELLDSKGALLFSLIDPLDYAKPEDAIKTAVSVAKAGADAILIGGSIGAQGELLDTVSKTIKDEIDIPLILFPGNIATITRYADAIYFMSLLNARNPYWITQAQTLSAPVIKQLKIEALPVGYIVVNPGGTVGWVGDVNIVPREKPKIAASLALAGEYLGNRFIITDVGSNPKMLNSEHVPNEMIRTVKANINVPYIVAGGVTSEKELKEVYASGADIVQIGTAFELGMAYKKAALFSRIAKQEGLKKLKGK